MALGDVLARGFFQHGRMHDLCSGRFVDSIEEQINYPALAFHWLTSR